jgi:hypothetical protein
MKPEDVDAKGNTLSEAQKAERAAQEPVDAGEHAGDGESSEPDDDAVGEPEEGAAGGASLMRPRKKATKKR